MNQTTKKSNLGVLIGAAFIMATSAIGPGFLTQTAQYTGKLKGSFGFVILVSVLLAVIVQMNVWRVICISGLRGQDIANKVLPGLGYVLAFFIALGGLAFNMGNVGGAALGVNAMCGLDVPTATLISGVLAILVFISKNAKGIVDQLVKILGGVMIIVIFIVIFIVKPPVGMAIKETILPSAAFGTMVPIILTLLGGTVGGYITFSGAHRLIDAGIVGKENTEKIVKTSIMGMGIATIVRILLFLAILGVVVGGATLDPANPAGDAFKQGAGMIGYRFFGVVLFSAAITSIIGAAYTSVSFIKTLSKTVNDHENLFIILFIAVSTIIMFAIGKPAVLLLLAGLLNGFILPLTLGVCLYAATRKEIMGDHYKHPTWLFVLGIVAFILTVILVGKTLPGSIGKIANLFIK